MKRSVFIQFETKVREFDGKLLLITELFLNGFDNIYLGSRGGIKTEALRSRDGIIFLKSLSKTEESFYSKLKERNFIIVLLHAEGSIYYKDNRHSIESIFPIELMKYVDYNFVMGDGIKKDIEKYFGVQNNCIVSGEPRFDLLKFKYYPFFTDEIKKIKKKYDDYILINTSFSVANPIVGRERLKQIFLNEPTYTNETKELLIIKMDFFNDILNDYLTMIEHISTHYPKINFIVRPHPSESETIYITKFKDKQNVFISKEGNVVNWILGAKVVIHYDCTTGMETRLAGKPVISFIPKIDERVVAWLPIELSKKAKNTEDIINIIESIETGTFDYDYNNNVEKIWGNTVHNVIEESSPLIVSYLLKNISGISEKFEKSRLTNNFRIIYFAKYYYSELKRIISGKDKSISQKKFDSCKSKEVRMKISVLKNIQSHKNNIITRQIRPDVVRISLENK